MVGLGIAAGGAGALVGGIVTNWDWFGLGLLLWLFFGIVSGIGALIVGSVAERLSASQGPRRMLSSAGAAIGAGVACVLATRPISLVHPWPVVMPIVMTVLLGTATFLWNESIWQSRKASDTESAPGRSSR